jgi:hypothetical protein
MRTVCRREAQRFQRHWQSRHGAAPRVVRDADLTERERTEAHLVLIGGPDVNSVTARLAPELPVDLRANSFRFAGRTYDGTSQGILMCYPSPYAPRRLIALAHGNSPAAVYQCLNRFGLWLEGAGPERNEWFDFGVFDAHTADPESFLHVGFFDNDWQLPDPENAPGGWSRRRGTVDRIDYRPQGFPAALTTTQARRALPVAGGPVYLTDLMPELINQPAGAVGFDRAFTGERLRVGGAPFDKGLGVKVPSEIVYHVGGVFSRFSSTVALTEGFKGQPDPVRKRHEKVVFEVWGDGELLTRSPALSWSDEGIAATRIHADVEGIFTLRLVVRPEGNAPPWLYGAASWCAPAIRR